MHAGPAGQQCRTFGRLGFMGHATPKTSWRPLLGLKKTFHSSVHFSDGQVTGPTGPSFKRSVLCMCICISAILSGSGKSYQ